MKLRDIGEFGFIDRIQKGCLVRPEGVVRAIGDDAAAFAPEPDRLVLVTTDLLVERVHFLTHRIGGEDLGAKSLAVNLSDIAAMGGEAREALVSLAVPDAVPLEYLEAVYGGMRAMAREHAVNILGGDTTGSRSDLMIAVTVTGSVPAGEMLARDGARPGDAVFATGHLGDSRAGLQWVLAGESEPGSDERELVRAHRRPRPHLAEGRFLAQVGGVRSAIDVSDGAGSDAGHIASASGVGMRFFADRVPVSDALAAYCQRHGHDPVRFALAGGEDYVLLCTAAAERADEIGRRFHRRFRRPLHRIGEVTEERELVLVRRDGGVEELQPEGWDHFRSSVPAEELEETEDGKSLDQRSR